VGQHAPAVLAVAGAVRDGLGGREPGSPGADGGLRGAVAGGVPGVLGAAAGDPGGAGAEVALAAAVGGDLKGKLSLASYTLAIGLAFVRPWLADGLYVLVALMWLVPDRRIERVVSEAEGASQDE